jgi:hypothetical protein
MLDTMLEVIVMPDLSLAEHWRQRAEALRAIADDLRTQDDRETLLYFATDLDAMAERLERSESPRFSESSRTRQ